MKKFNGDVVAEIISFVIGGILLIGWIINLAGFFGLNFESPYRAEAIRGIGVFTPIGSILGYIDIND